MVLADRTSEFLSCVAQLHEGQLPSPPKEPETSFTLAVRPLRETIREMMHLIRSQEREYMNFNQHVSSEAALMTDAERDMLELEASRFASVCGVKIDTLEKTITQDKEGSARDVQAHRRTVIICLYDCLKQVTAYMQRMKALRTQRLKDDAQRQKPAHYQIGGLDPSLVFESDEEDVGEPPSESEQQELQQENDRMMEELQNNLDQMRQAEQKMVEIAGSLSLFSTKVVEQEEQINSIYNAAVESSNNIRMGNAQLQQALDRGVGSRFMILFVLVLASFSLLFLDWYSTS